jgi:hypothetical protein
MQPLLPPRVPDRFSLHGGNSHGEGRRSGFEFLQKIPVGLESDGGLDLLLASFLHNQKFPSFPISRNALGL